MSYANQNLYTLRPPRRNNYFYGKLMGELQFQMEQAYGIQYRWMMNRLTLGTGVLCGLLVGADSERKNILISPGVAVNALGQEIIVPQTVKVNPWQLSNECGQVTGEVTSVDETAVYICLAYRECPADFMPTMVADCNNQDDCAPGTIIDTYCVLVTTDQPARPATTLDDCKIRGTQTSIFDADHAKLSLSERLADLYHNLLTDCPEHGEPACVPLAQVRLQKDTITDIDCWTYRPVVYSNAMLLELIMCLAARVEECCSGSTPPPTTMPPTTLPPTTIPPTTLPPTTIPPTTLPPTTIPPTTLPPTTLPPTTVPPTTVPPTTVPPTTLPPTTIPPTTDPPTTDPPNPELLRVNAVEIYAGTRLLGLVDLANLTQIPASDRPDTIRVTFINKPVDISSVVDGKTFIVVDPAGKVLPGSIALLANNTVRWKVTSVDPPTLRSGGYKLILEGDAILDTNKQLLDGEVINLVYPSGNGYEGGQFVCAFAIT